MEKFWTIVLVFLFLVIAFILAVFISSAINKIEVYDILCLWFGPGSNFAKIFTK